MKLPDMIEMLRENLKTLKIALVAYLVVLVLFDFSLSRENVHYLIDKIYAYWAMFGTVGCFLLIKFSKGIAHMFLSKNEDYYE
jgi:hypothetical protein